MQLLRGEVLRNATKPEEREALVRIVEVIERELKHFAPDSEWRLACLTIRRQMAADAGLPLARQLPRV